MSIPFEIKELERRKFVENSLGEVAVNVISDSNFIGGLGIDVEDSTYYYFDFL